MRSSYITAFIMGKRLKFAFQRWKYSCSRPSRNAESFIIRINSLGISVSRALGHLISQAIGRAVVTASGLAKGEAGCFRGSGCHGRLAWP